MMKKVATALCTVSALAFVAPAFAQASAQANQSGTPLAEATDPSDTIIVTARRREEDVQNVPVVVNTVTSETIGKLNLQNFSEVQSLVPGLQLRSEATGVGASAQIRGITYDGNSSAQPSVEFYLNDAPITSTYVQQQLYDIGQIEVERGPQGTLRGRSSPSGSISITTRKPSLSEIGGYVSMSGSDIGTININGAVGAPVIDGVLAVRLAGLWTEGEVNRVRTINPGLDGRDPYSRTRAGRVSAVFEPADWLRLEGVYQHLANESRSYTQYASFSLVNPSAPPSPVLISPRDRLSIQETPGSFSQAFDVFNWRGEFRFAGQKLIYQGQYAKLKVDSTSNSDPANFFNNVDYFSTTSTRSTTRSHEVRLQNEERLFGSLDYVVGFFDWTQASPTHLLSDTPIVLPPFLGGGVAFVAQTPIDTSQTVNERSFFGNVTAHIGDKLQVSAGARHIHFTSPANDLVIGGNVLPGAAQVDENNWIYSASAQYSFSSDVMIYASTGTSRRPGPTIVGIFSLAESARQRSFKYLQSESSTSYEIGLKSTLFDRRVRLNVTGYHQTFDNYPYKLSSGVYYQNFTFVPGTGVVPVVSQSSQFAANVPVEVNGVEVELGVKVTPRFDLSIVASYSNGKIKNGLIPCDDLNGDGVPDVLTSAPTLAQVQAAYGANYVGACRTNQRSSNQSPFSATVQAEYSLPISNKADFFARGLFSFQGNSINDPNNGFDDIGSYGLLNVFSGVRDPNGAWEINFYAKNLLNTVKATSFGLPVSTGYQELQPPTFTTTAGASATSTYSQITTTPPREFGLNVRFAFGSR